MEVYGKSWLAPGWHQKPRSTCVSAGFRPGEGALRRPSSRGSPASPKARKQQKHSQGATRPNDTQP